MSREVVRLILAWAALIALLTLTATAAFLTSGPARIWIGYTIASAKAGLILWFFMEMRREGGIPRLAAIAGFIWMAFLLILTGADYATRSWFTG